MNTAILPHLRHDVIVRPFDSATTQVRYVAAVDDRHFVVSPAVAAVLIALRSMSVAGDPPESIESLARDISERVGVPITPRELQALFDEKIPSVLFERAARAHRAETPLMFQRRLIGGVALAPLLRLAGRLFDIRIAAMLVCLCVLLDVLLGIRLATAAPFPATASEIVGGFALTLAGILLHELGHLAACHRYGGRHGGIGVGLYWCLPAFYAEVHGAWTLPRRHRATVDIAGIYFQFVFLALLGALYLIAPFPGLLSALGCTQLLMLHTLNPVLKFDGYWLLSDLAGVHNLHTRIREIARGAFRVGAAGPPLDRADLILMGSFLAIALVYFAYLSVMLGRGIALATHQLITSSQAQGVSPDAIGHGVLLAFLLAVAVGTGILLARSTASVILETSHEP